MIGEFSTSLIDHDQNVELDESASCTKKPFGNHKIIELKGNFIHKGLVPLEILFSKYDNLLKPTMNILKKMS